jgi:hypothetical protein
LIVCTSFLTFPNKKLYLGSPNRANTRKKNAPLDIFGNPATLVFDLRPVALRPRLSPGLPLSVCFL